MRGKFLALFPQMGRQGAVRKREPSFHESFNQWESALTAGSLTCLPCRVFFKKNDRQCGSGVMKAQSSVHCASNLTCFLYFRCPLPLNNLPKFRERVCLQNIDASYCANEIYRCAKKSLLFVL